MKILVFGAGALGSFVGGLLSQEYDVLLYGRKDKMQAVKDSGLRITGKTEIAVNPKTAFESKDLHDQNFDLIILCVKSYDTEPALKIIKKIVNEDTKVLSLQNGLDNETIISKTVGLKRTLGGVTSHGLTFIEPGHVHHAGEGETTIGEMDGKKTKKILEIAEALSSVRIATQVSENIGSEIWAKGIVNAGINPLTALTRLKNGYLLKIPPLTALLEDTCREGVAVANAEGMELEESELIDKTENVARLTAENRSSMLQDIERGKRTEIDSINGRIVEIGREHGISTPVNRALVALVKGVEEGTN